MSPVLCNDSDFQFFWFFSSPNRKKSYSRDCMMVQVVHVEICDGFVRRLFSFQEIPFLSLLVNTPRPSSAAHCDKAQTSQMSPLQVFVSSKQSGRFFFFFVFLFFVFFRSPVTAGSVFFFSSFLCFQSSLQTGVHVTIAARIVRKFSVNNGWSFVTIFSNFLLFRAFSPLYKPTHSSP